MLSSAATRCTSRERFIVRQLGHIDYTDAWRRMQSFTAARQAQTPDEIWFAEHPPVFTQGRNGRPEHLLATGTVPVVQTDRGGQVTYHGPGQLLAYVLLDIRRRRLGVQSLVCMLEQAVIDLLKGHGITGQRQDGAPGVYVNDRKLAALGLRVTRGCSYHGLALNVDMDLAPFNRINPCGYRNLQVTQLRDLGVDMDLDEAALQFGTHLERHLAEHT